MGNYNPNNPVILGMEWVPVADVREPIDIQTELGYGFTVTGAPHNVIANANLYYTEPASQMVGQTPFVSVYPRGFEDRTGDVGLVRLVADVIAVTGASIVGSDPLLTPGDGAYISFDNVNDRARLSFLQASGADIQATLQGKRILGVDFIYQAAGTPGFALEPTLESFATIYPYGPFITGPATLDQVGEFGNVRFGEVNPYWNATATPSFFRYPFRWEEIARLSTATAPRIFVGVRVNSLPLSGEARLGYAALNIYYCEETRVRYGGVAIGADTSGFFLQPSGSGIATVEFRTTALAIPAVGLTGDHTVTTSQADAGDKYNGQGLTFPLLRQKYEIQSHPGVEIRKFLRPSGSLSAAAPLATPTQDIRGVAMTELDDVTAVGFGEAPFSYVIMGGAPVYVNSAGTSITAVQQIHNEAPVTDTTYEWVRFYARRFSLDAPGNLTVSVSGSGSATITAEEFAALPEITLGDVIDGSGWREVTLPINAVFSSDATFRNVTFSMTGIGASTQSSGYQVLVTRTLFDQFGSTSDSAVTVLGADKSRYDGLQNGNLTWAYPRTGGTTPTLTTNSTAVVMFSQLSPTATGFAVTGSGCALEVAATRRGCETGTECIPTHILGNRLAWDFNVVCDDFMRTSVNGWGVSTSGEAWTATGGSASDYSVMDGKAFIAQPNTNVGRRVVIDGPLLNPDVSAALYPQSVAQTASFFMGVQLRRDSVNNNEYVVEAEFTTTGAVNLRLRRNVAGTFTTLTSTTLPITYTADSVLRIRGRVVGSLLQGKVWLNGSPEPLDWQSSVTDTTVTAAGVVGVRAITNTTTTGTPTVAYGDFMAVPTELHNGSIEIQRMDEVDDEWQTIVDTDDLCLNSFCDYEARAGVTSWYRIRSLNRQDFEGPWVSGSGFLASPGVSGVGDGNSVLIFTSNRAPESSLAYVMQFENDPVEEFAFPEAGFQQLRTQYQKDYFTAFRPLERGGEVFTRDILVHDAAIPIESLANFREIRDLAWATLPYVCVRDELGNRWFANVAVPAGRVRNNRTIYIAQIQITEVSDTPAPYTGE